VAANSCSTWSNTLQPLSHSLRLFGNMYAGEIIFLLLWMMAGRGASPARFFAVPLAPGVAIFHTDRRAAGVHFHVLTIVYIAMAHESIGSTDAPKGNP